MRKWKTSIILRKTKSGFLIYLWHLKYPKVVKEVAAEEDTAKKEAKVWENDLEIDNKMVNKIELDTGNIMENIYGAVIAQFIPYSYVHTI